MDYGDPLDSVFDEGEKVDIKSTGPIPEKADSPNNSENATKQSHNAAAGGSEGKKKRGGRVKGAREWTEIEKSLS